MKCPLCRYETETEIHFVLCCPALDDLRSMFIPWKYYIIPNAFKLTMLIANKNEQIIRNFGIFLYKAFSRREIVVT